MARRGPEIFALWAIRRRDEGALMQAFGSLEDCRRCGEALARGSGDDGAVSLWIQTENETIVWALGEMAQELSGLGFTVSQYGDLS